MTGLARLVAAGCFGASVLACNTVLSLGDYHELKVCARNSECIAANAGKPAICRKNDHICVSLINDDCPNVSGPVDDDNAIVIGTLFTLKGTNKSSGVARTQSVELALGEITQTIVGLPGGVAGAPRPLVALECDDSSDVTVATRAAKHLRDVGVPAIIGPGGSGIVAAVAQSVTIPSGIFLISPSATSATLSGLDPLVWRTAPSDVVQAVELQHQVGELAKIVTGPKVKLAVVYQDNPYGNGLLTALSAGLTLNGAPVGDPSNGGLYAPKAYDATKLDPSAAVAQILAEPRPQIIALFGTAEIITKFIAPLEAGWLAGDGGAGAPRPQYLLADAGKRQELLDLLKGNEDLRKRVRGTVPGTAGASYQAFSLGYQGKFSQTPGVFGMAGAYDSTYMMAYAIGAIGAQAITGGAIAAQMPKLVKGTKTAVGPGALSPTMKTMTSTGTIDIDGASGPLDFDLNQHEAPSDIDVWCVTLQTGDEAFTSSGSYYDSSTKTPVDAFTKCQ